MKINSAKQIVIKGRTYFVMRVRGYFSQTPYYRMWVLLNEQDSDYLGTWESLTEFRKWARSVK